MSPWRKTQGASFHRPPSHSWLGRTHATGSPATSSKSADSGTTKISLTGFSEMSLE